MPLTQTDKASLFRQQHLAEKLLLLPNVWDTLSAKVVGASGFPSLATASAAIALANGYKDGEHIPFARLMEIVRQITGATDLPVTVDMERGFAGDIPQLKENIRALIGAGAVGLNIEDGLGKGKGLAAIDAQCLKIEAIKEVGIQCGVPLVINARTDIFLQPATGNPIDEAIKRGKAYKNAGADCLFLILINNYDDLARVLEGVSMPVNVSLLKPISDLKKLESMGVARVSMGPTLLKLALTKIKNATEGLLHYQTEAVFGEELLSNDFIDRLA